MPLKDAETGAYQELYAGAWMSFISKTGDGMPPALRRLGDRLSLQVPRIKAKLTTPPRTIIHGDYRLDNCIFQTSSGAQSLLVFDWEFCARGRGTYDFATFVREAFSSQQRRDEELSLIRTCHSILVSNGVKDYPFAECLADYRLSMLEIFVFWIVTGATAIAMTSGPPYICTTHWSVSTPPYPTLPTTNYSRANVMCPKHACKSAPR